MSFHGEPPSWLMRPEGGGDRVGLAVAGHDAAAIAAVAGGDKERLRAEGPERPARRGRGLVAPPCRPVSAMGEGHATTPPLRRRPGRAPRPGRACPCPECAAKPVSGLREHDLRGSRALALPSRPRRRLRSRARRARCRPERWHTHPSLQARCNTLASAFMEHQRYPEAIAFFEDAGRAWPDRGANRRGL